jgi:RNA polymerase sigma factor (TIGR02999 family)
MRRDGTSGPYTVGSTVHERDSDEPDGAAPGEVTALLRRWQGGDEGALEELAPLVYDQLRRVARRQMRRERAGHTLEPTAVVHEVYLRLVDQRQARWQNRAQFFAVAARMVRRVLLNHARDRRAQKRGGDAVRLTLVEADAQSGPREVDLIDLDQALQRLGELDALQERLVELRYFAGLTIEETAAVMGSSPATVKRDWQSARAWLFAELTPGSP